MAARTLATATSEGSLADLSDTVGPTGNTNDAGPSFWDAVLKPALQDKTWISHKGAHHATTLTWHRLSMPVHAPSTRVKLGGLKAKPELNGLSATIESFVEASGRYNVKLDDGTVLALKPENLEQLPTTQTATASTADADERAVSVRCSAALWYPDEPSLASATTLKLTLSSK